MSSLPSPPSPPPGDPHPEEVSRLCAAAVALRDRGEWAQAIATLNRALALGPNFAEGWLELGNTHMLAECLPEAIAAYQRAIALETNLGEARINLAMAYREQGRIDDAIEAYRAGLAIDPNDAEALMDLGLLLQQQEQWKEALATFQQARAIAPSAALLVRLGDLFVRLEDPQGAVSPYRQALQALAPGEDETLRVQILARLGVALHRLGQLEEAIHAYGQALGRQPDLMEIHTHRNAALAQLRATLVQIRQALHGPPATIGPQPDGPGGEGGDRSQAGRLAQFGMVLHRAGALPEAIACYERALALQADLEAVPSLRAKAMEQWQDPQLLLTIARRFNLLALFNDELATLEQAAALDPSNRAIQLDRGLSLLRFGRFAEGWPLFEWRRTGFKPADSLPSLEPGLVCQSLLILPEDGLGDQIMFASLLDQSVALAPDQAVVVDPRLRSLMERSFPHLQVITTAETIQTNQFQAQIRMGSLAAHQPPSKAHFHAHRKAYLSADPGKTQALRHRHLPNPRSGELLCGISWRSTSPANGAMKSVNLEALAKALALPGVRLLSLQYGDTQAERDDLRRSTGLEVLADPQIDPFADIDGLAALINACDLVVSVSNTTAHLAAALGQRTWLLIDSRLDWRWGLDDPDSLWSPTTRLFRQLDPGDWATPLGTIQEELTILQRHHPLRSALDTPGPGARPSPPPEANRKWVF